MLKKLVKFTLPLLLVAALAPALWAQISETRYQYDPNFPSGVFSLTNFRNNLRGLHQMDVAPLRPTAKRIVDGMEYGSTAAAAGAYSGTGVTITTNATTFVGAGNYSLKAVTDGTSNRSFERAAALDLSPFTTLTLWEQSDQSSDTIQFYLEDSGGDQSYWDITTNATTQTWQQDTLTLSSPDGNSGTPADLSDVSAVGYKALTANAQYYFDEIKAKSGMAVVVEGTDLGDYYRHVYLNEQPLQMDPATSPTITAPSSNPRIDILEVNSSGTLSWVTGTEATTPSAPWASVSNDKIQIAEVYMKPTMTEVLDYEDKDTDTNQGYIRADVRPIIDLGTSYAKGADVASAAHLTLGNDGNLFDITGTTNVTTITAKPAGTNVFLQFDDALTVTDGSNLKLNGNFTTAAESTMQLVSDGTNWYEISRSPTAGAFTALSDTPSSLSGQALKNVRVNAGGTALEFTSPTFLLSTDTPSSYSGQAGKYPRVNSGETAVEFVKNPADYVSGAYLIYGPTTIKTISYTGSYQKAIEMFVPRGGTISVKFGGVCFNGPNSGSGRVYVNGSAVGTERSLISTWQDFTEDISVSSGDLLQVYINPSSGSGCAGGAIRLYENVPNKEVSVTTSPLMFSGDADPTTRLGAMGSLGDIYLYTSGGAYVKTGASTWTAM